MRATQVMFGILMLIASLIGLASSGKTSTRLDNLFAIPPSSKLIKKPACVAFQRAMVDIKSHTPMTPRLHKQPKSLSRDPSFVYREIFDNRAMVMAYHDRMQHMYLSAIGAMGQCIEEMKEVTASWVEETAALVERNAELENKATALVEVIAEVVAQAHENEL